MAVTKLVAGWMAGAVLGVAALRSQRAGNTTTNKSDKIGSSSRISVSGKFILHGGLFIIAAAGLILVTVYFLAPQLMTYIPDANLIIVLGGLTLIGMGLLKLGFSEQVFMVIIGLLTTLLGFEIIYSSLENSTLVAGLISMIILGISLSGAYMMSTPEMDELE